MHIITQIITKHFILKGRFKMPKLIYIKRPFARKTKDMPENNEYEKNLKNLVLKMQEAEDIFTKLAKAFSVSKKNLKSSFHQEHYK